LALIPREKIDDVRERTNLVEVVRRHVELKRAGTGSWKGLCPFHTEKTPSFNVHEQKQFFYCFGCGEKGDVFTFLTKIEQRSFMEVLRELAPPAGVELPEKEMSPAERRARAEEQSERERMFRTMEIATAFFEEQLASPAGEAARAYLKSRALGDETARRFRVGYAPAGWDTLQRHLASKQVPVHVSEQLGLVGVNDRGRYDFFRDRVMLPVGDRQGRPIGYSSRLLDPAAKDRKYVNSPDSPLFHKKENLYGIHAAAGPIRKSGLAIVVEGNFDVMSLHDAGVDEAVAPMGTALTLEQVTQLCHMARRVVVVFDGDEAGQRAARKALPLFLEADGDGRVAHLPAGVDPDDFVRSQGAEAFRRLVDTARPVVEQFIDDLSRETDEGILDRVRALETAAQVLVKVRNPTARELYCGRLATTLQVSSSEVMRAVRAASAGVRPVQPSAPQSTTTVKAVSTTHRVPPKEQIEALVLLVTHPELAPAVEAQRVLELLVDQGVRPLYRAALETLRRGERLDIPAWLDAGPEDVRQAVSQALMTSPGYEVTPGTGAADAAARAMRALKTRLELSRVAAEIEEMKSARSKALQQGDQEAAKEFTKREMELIRTKVGLSNALARP
jgi:DNA primase